MSSTANTVEEEYLVEVVWSFPYSGKSPITIKGSCMEDAVNKFYQFRSGGEIMHIYEHQYLNTNK